MESYKLYNEHLSNASLKLGYPEYIYHPESTFRGSEADLFAPSIAAASSVHQFPTTGPGPQSVIGSTTGASVSHSIVGGAPHSIIPSQFGIGSAVGSQFGLPVGQSAAANMFSQVSALAANDAKKVKLDPLSKSVSSLSVGNALNVNGSGIVGSAVNGGTLGAQLGNFAGGLPNVVTSISAANASLVNCGGNLGQGSKVVMISNLPDATSNAELISLGANDGKITAATVMEQKHQGFLEFEDERSAANLVQRCRIEPVVCRGNQLIVNFGNTKDMKSMITSANGYQAAAMHDPHRMGLPVADVNVSGAYGSMAVANSHFGGSPPSNGGTNGEDRTVLRVIVEMGENQNIYNQVNLDVLQHLFSRTGFVMKIITFAKPGYPQQFQALIQYMEPKSAQTAKELFDGQNLYYGCCPLKVEYSKLTTLNVKYNNEKSRDFTRPDLPTGEGPTPLNFNVNDPATASAALALGLTGGLPSFPMGLGSPATAAASQFASNPLGPAAALNPLALHTFCDPLLQLQFALNAANGLPPALQLPPNANAALLQHLQRNPAIAALQPVNITNTSANTVLLVGNLNTEKVTCDGLFTLFGVYGDVQRVKILFNTQDKALIQMSLESQANLAIENLNEIKLYGKDMRVSLSKHTQVQMPKEGQPDAGLTKDYTNSPLHRFRKQGSKNYQNIYPPSSTLHLSNIAPGATEEQILDAFSKKTVDVVSFRFFPDPDDNDHKMALLQCRSKEDAVMALVELHNYQLGENHHLRVSFSKTQMGMASAATVPTSGLSLSTGSPSSAASVISNGIQYSMVSHGLSGATSETGAEAVPTM